MQNKPKIFVLQLKEVIYTAMFILLAILFILLIFWMFSSKNSQETNTTTETSSSTKEAGNFTSGIYHSCITLNNVPLELEVTLDSTKIKSVNFVNLNDSVSTLYPMLEECISHLEEQICLTSSLDEITYPQDEQYTSMILMEGIRGAIEKAQ